MKCVWRRLVVCAQKLLAAAAATMLPKLVLAAGFSCARPPEAGSKQALEELEEVVVTGEKVRTKTRDLREWLRLLPGMYSYEGYIDLCGNGNSADTRPVSGESSCVASSERPNVLCTVNVRWPEERGKDGEPTLGGVSNLSPAYVIYSLENRFIPDKQVHVLGLMFTQVDNNGVAEWASGTLVGDTFISSEPCVDMPGSCRKMTRIAVSPDSKEIHTRVDVEVDNQRVLHQSFVMRRELNSRNGSRTPESSP